MAGVITGGCRCEAVRYRLKSAPLFTHACHCLDCQRQTGSAFWMATIVLRRDLEIVHGVTVSRRKSTHSTEQRCATCDTTLYVESTRFPVSVILRSGTLDDARIATPQAHIWVKRKQPWLTLPAGALQFDEGYDPLATWPSESLARLRAAEQTR